MPRHIFWVGLLALSAIVDRAQAQQPVAPLTAGRILEMSRPELDGLFAQGTATLLPSGKVRGTPITAPGTSLGPARSKAARILWQGKVVDAEHATAVNRFVGIKLIRGDLQWGTSWMDGRPALLLDYQATSRIYARNRDEIRQVGPGLYLGRMYSRTSPQPTFVMDFILEVVN